MLTSLRSALARLPRRWQWVAAAVIVAGLAAGGVTGYALTRPSSAPVAFPQNASIESRYGVRFSRVAVVGDGGLITVSYVVLDSEKASRFQSDVTLRPALRSESRHGGTTRVSVMKQGHTLSAGQTYYFVYENTRGALRPGETVTIVEGDLRLPHAPVL